MNKAVLAVAFVFGLSIFAFAGPEPISSSSGKETKQVVQLQPTCPNWTGFYVGGFGGYKFSNVDVDLDSNNELRVHGEDLGPALESAGSHDLDNSGAELGGVIGYNYQWHNWVFGLEGAAGYLWARESDAEGFFDVPVSVVDLKVSSSFKTHYLATLAPRIGYSFCRWMPYVTGGVAFGDLEFAQGYKAVRAAGITLFASEDEHETNVGWMVGGGLEYALTNHWRVRGQYQYIDLGEVSFDTITDGVLQGATLFGAHHRAELTEHNASFAVIYGF